MTQEEKSLLIKDLCARLPYGVKIFIRDTTGKHLAITERTFDTYVIQFFKNNNILIKPYLRPMSSMTEEEKEEYRNIDNRSYSCPIDYAHIPASDRINWLNAHHFDYRGLIDKGLALKALEGMYDIK